MYPSIKVQTQPDKLAAILPSTGETLTYGQLNARSNQLAHALRAAGLKAGDHVAAFLDNRLAYLEITCACMRSGLYLTPVNRYLTAAEAAYIVDDCDATVLIASAALDQSAALGALSPRCQVKLSVGGHIEGFTDYDATLMPQPVEDLPDERLGALMLYSSGTTGKPKGILRALPSQDVSLGNPNLNFTGGMYGFSESTIYLSPAPLYHAAPLGSATAALQYGGTVVVMDKFDAETALQLIEQYKVTHCQWVPAMFVRLLKLAPEIRSKYDLSSQICAIHAAAPCPVEVKRQMIDWFGPVVLEYYSSTEGAGMASINSTDWLAHQGSVGRAYGKPFHICDDAGNELPRGTPGNIYGELPSGVQFEYHKAPEKTASVRHPLHQDWVTTGDIGYLDNDGYLYLTDRQAFMIISGGVNIYPQQIEDALALHPKIADVAVIGVPSEEMGEEVKAVVELAPGVAPSEELAEEIKEFVRARLGRQLVPRSVDFVDQLPRLPTGKLYKKELRARYWPADDGKTSLAARG
jgi:long-chain acyl-CoA synthetase